MYRFLACHWVRKCGHAQAVADQIALRVAKDPDWTWQSVARSSSFQLWHADADFADMPAVPIGHSGHVLGRLFQSSTSGTPHRVSSVRLENERHVRTEPGTFLARHYWGQYIAFVEDIERGALHVVRDPTGVLPCFHVELKNVRIFFSDIEDIYRLLGVRFAVDYNFLGALLVLPRIQKTVVGLSEVNEVLPAQQLSVCPEGIRGTFTWNPFEFAQDLISDRAAAKDALRQSVESAVETLACQFGTILHNVGGLDSSIVLACLGSIKHRTNVLPVNFFTRSPGGDERIYSRHAAAHAGLNLKEAELLASRVVLEKLDEGPLQPSPIGMFDCAAPAGDMYGIAADAGADSLFYGVGGDNVFFQLPYVFSGLDYARSGLGHGSLSRTILEAALYGNRSVGRTALMMGAEPFRRARPFDRIYRFLAPSLRWTFSSKDLLASGPRTDLIHPLLLSATHVPVGKYFHVISSAFQTVEYYDHWQFETKRPLERVFPLLAQPVVETCLRIPTWHLVSGGVDRGLARMAFGDILAPSVLRRTSKSNPDLLYAEVFNQNRPLIRERLLDGPLAGSGILQRDVLEENLNHDSVDIRTVGVLLDLFSWDAWVSRWNSRTDNEQSMAA